jgi:hypothetical protein
MRSLAFLCSALLLAACGGGHGSSGENTPPAPPPQVMADAFFTKVLSFVASSPEDTEPADVDNVAQTAPDDKEPEPVN